MCFSHWDFNNCGTCQPTSEVKLADVLSAATNVLDPAGTPRMSPGGMVRGADQVAHTWRPGQYMRTIL